MRDPDCVALLRAALPRLGLRYEGFRRVRGQVCKRIARRLRELGLADAGAYRAWLETHPDEWAAFDAACRISISRFYRDCAVFESLASEVLPALAELAVRRGEHTLRAWSAGCASGEEPWTLRILWDLALARRFPALALEVTATDADARLLERARRARYSASSLRELPEAWRAQAFEPRGGAFELRPAFRHGVDLAEQDLRQGAPTGPFHLVLCRNLAFTYFAAERQRATLLELAARLVPGGALVLGLHEDLPESEAFAPWVGVRAVWRRTASSLEPVRSPSGAAA